VGQDHLKGGVAHERRLAGQQEVGEAAQAVHVAAASNSRLPVACSGDWYDGDPAGPSAAATDAAPFANSSVSPKSRSFTASYAPARSPAMTLLASRPGAERRGVRGAQGVAHLQEQVHGAPRRQRPRGGGQFLQLRPGRYSMTK